MSKRPALRALSAAEPAPQPQPVPAATAKARVPLPPSRVGKKQLSMYVDESYVTQLKMFAVREGTTVQACMEEAHDLWAAAHGLHRIRET